MPEKPRKNTNTLTYPIGTEVLVKINNNWMEGTVEANFSRFRRYRVLIKKLGTHAWPIPENIRHNKIHYLDLLQKLLPPIKNSI